MLVSSKYNNKKMMKINISASVFISLSDSTKALFRKKLSSLISGRK